MAKLYWRVKLNGKWTWRPANMVHHEIYLHDKMVAYIVDVPVCEEEE